MKSYVFDLEADGLNELIINKKGEVETEVTRIHCLVLRSYPSGDIKVYRNNGIEDTIQEGWDELRTADNIIGHQIIAYDLPVLQRFYEGGVEGKVFDTLVAARILWPDAKNHPHGGNSVEDLAKVCGCEKIGLDITDWSVWTQEIEDRCVQDTYAQAKIFELIKRKVKQFPVALKLEHKVAEICAAMQDNGVSINVEAAEELVEVLELDRALAMDELQQAFPPIIEYLKTPQFYRDEEGNQYKRKKDAPSKIRKTLMAGPMRYKEHPFNPGSSQQIADRFKEKYGWEAPTTEKGNPTIPEDTLKTLDFEEAGLLLRVQMADKRLQHLTDWIKRARNSRTPGRIHPSINPLGAATSRATHKQPNQTACPKVLDPELRGYEGRYGWEMRSLWGPREGWIQIGGDASGLELRMLGHSLYPWDKGAYGREILEGDIHTLNQEAGGLKTRDQAKTVIYAYLYGAGDEHIGELITNHFSLTPQQITRFRRMRDEWCKGKKIDHTGKTPEQRWLTRKGREFRQQFERKIPALAKLTAWCRQCASERGFIPLLDGRHAPVRSEHSALNTKLQGDGAIVMKLGLVLLANKLTERGYLWKRVAFMLWPHDEWQLEAEPELGEEVGELLVESIVEAGKRLKLTIPLDGEYKIGSHWAECH